MEHKAGDKMYIDFAGEKLSITDKHTGEVQNMEVFVAILGCSQLAYNETFADFAEHYGTSILPARAYRPKDKSLVEGMVKIVYRKVYAVLSNCTYFSLDALNAAIRTAMEELNNAPFKGRNYSRRQQFEEVERGTLLPLPVYRYEFKQQQVATIMKNGHVCLGMDKYYYSVPYLYIGKKVKLLFTPDQVEIF